MIVQYPKIDGVAMEQIQPIIIKTDNNSKKAKFELALAVIYEILETVPYWWWFGSLSEKRRFISKTFSKHGKAKLLHTMNKHHGEIALPKTPLMIKVRNGRITINMRYWLSHYKSPNPQLALAFLRPIVDRLTRESATYQEVEETSIRLVRQSPVIINLLSNEPATPEETQQLVNQLAREAWMSLKSL